MSRFPKRLGGLLVWSLLAIRATSLNAWQQPPDEADSPNPRAIEELAKAARDSVLLISVQGRDGKPHGLGTGFVVSSQGLIATNHHVIGEARPISVQLANGKSLEVTAIHASDRDLDLAILRVDANDLAALPLADSSRVQDGESVVAIGHPRGLKHSVVSGVVSGRREVDKHRMLQLAIPIESGNSGGPVLDRHGRVVGIVTMKSLVTNNLGFAVEINELKPLLDRPNPIPMSRWLTIGALDAKDWTTRLGANWQQRGGKISVSGGGDAFGRALCLRNNVALELPFEIAVAVRMDDESGAAGLVFHADTEHKHYGFYPSNGNLRFSRFDGPHVEDWKVLREIPAAHYRPGEWNRLKVRVELDKVVCYVNDQAVLEVSDGVYREGQIGLVKFRQTQAEFKHFEYGSSLSSREPTAEVQTRLDEQVANLPRLDSIATAEIEELAATAGTRGAETLRRRAQVLERQSIELRQLANDLFTREVLQGIQTAMSHSESEVELIRACLLVAKLDEQEIDVDDYLRQVERMAREIRAELVADAPPTVRRQALDKYLFQENGFHGSRFEYYHRANSYLNRLLDDHEGLPLTLSILYQELGKQLDLKIEGIPLPGHFLVRFVHPEEPEQSVYLDLFEGAKPVTRDELLRRATAAVGSENAEQALEPATRKQMLQRMLANLSGIAQRENDSEAMLRYYDALVVLDPGAGQTRFDRARLRFQTGRHEQAIQELNWFLENSFPGIDPDGVRAIQAEVRRSKSSR